MRRVLCLFLFATPLLLLTSCDSGGGAGHNNVYIFPTEDTDPAVSPDGSRIAYWHSETDEAREGAYPTGLYVLDLASGERSPVRAGAAFTPDWSPDGEWLAVSAGGIALVRPDGGDFRYLTDHGSAFFPAWSPDGLRLAYDATSLGTDQNGIWLMSNGGSARKHLGLGRSAAWLPSGERIAYAGGDPDGDSGSEIWTADTSGTERVQLTDNDFYYNRGPAVSPDGEHIVWAAQEGDGRLSIWMMRSDGSEQRRLVREGRYPAWSADGERVVFQAPTPGGVRASVHEGGARLVLWSIHRDGSDRQQLTF